MQTEEQKKKRGRPGNEAIPLYSTCSVKASDYATC